MTPFLLWNSSILIGIGTWTMHFIGMFSYIPLVESEYYDAAMIMGSLLFAVGYSYVALFVVFRQSRKYFTLIGSLLMGLGVCSMHFIGMKALYPSITITYDLKYNVLAAFIALLGLYYAFQCFIQCRTDRKKGINILWLKWKSSFIMGMTLVMMHYTSMFGITHVSEASVISPAFRMNAMTLSLFLGLGTLVILLLVIIASYINEKLSIQAQSLKQNEQHYQSLFDQNPDIVHTFDLNGYHGLI